jgi:chaperonin cofactor prefoldin
MQMANGGGPKRVLTKDLEPRIVELERKLSELTEQIARLDERIQKIANSLAASQANRF